MPRDAFGRARRFLQYHPLAAWGAIVTSISLGLLYVALLAVLGLFADLITTRGRVDSAEVNAVGEWLTEKQIIDDPERVASLLQNREPNGLGLIPLAWRNRDSWLGGALSAPLRWFPWTHENRSYLIGLLLVGVGLVLLRGVLSYLMHHLAAKAAVEASTRLRRAVYHQTYRLGTLAFHELGASEAIGVFTRHLEGVHEGLYSWLTHVFREPVKIILLLAFAFAVESSARSGPPLLSLAFLLFALLVWLIGGQLATHFRQLGRLNVRRSAEQLALLQESLRLMRLAKCYVMELFNQTRVERQLSEYGRSLMERYRGRSIYRQTLIVLGAVAGVVLLFAVGWNVQEGTLSVAAIITLMLTLVSLALPIWRLLEQRRTLRRARQSAEVLFHFLDRRGEVGQVVGAEFLPPLSKWLEFVNVTLREPGTGRLLLDQVSLQIAAGQRVALVGQEEMEKHALVYLIPRFLDPQDGEIRIDGRNLRWVTLESLRVQVALVLQHHLVFNDTVANNIGCGDSGYTLPQIIEAAKVAHAHQFIQLLPQGYETRIGELGHRLSLADQFRIALARAILRDPALIIIEEPTNTLDDDVKGMLDDTYARFLPGRTAIFLPHRLSTIRSCDRVFLLNKGRVLASGEHRELLNQSELYRHLQYLEFNVFAEAER